MFLLLRRDVSPFTYALQKLRNTQHIKKDIEMNVIAWLLCLDRAPTKAYPPKSYWTPLRWMEYVNFSLEHLVYVLLPPRSAWNSKIWEATEHLHTEVSVPRGSSLTPPPLLFHAHCNARQTSERVGVHGDSDINKPASKTVQILLVTLHLLPVVLTLRACTVPGATTGLSWGASEANLHPQQNLLPRSCLNQVNASLIHLFIHMYYWWWKTQKQKAGGEFIREVTEVENYPQNDTNYS